MYTSIKIDSKVNLIIMIVSETFEMLIGRNKWRYLMNNWTINLFMSESCYYYSYCKNNLSWYIDVLASPYVYKYTYTLLYNEKDFIYYEFFNFIVFLGSI